MPRLNYASWVIVLLVTSLILHKQSFEAYQQLTQPQQTTRSHPIRTTFMQSLYARKDSKERNIFDLFGDDDEDDNEDDEDLRRVRDLFHRNPPNSKKVIDVEAEEVDPYRRSSQAKEIKPRDAKAAPSKTSEPDEGPSPLSRVVSGAVNLAASTAKAAIKGISSFFPADTPEEREEKRRMKEIKREEEKLQKSINSALDDAFKGTGLLGGVTKTILKSALGSMTSAAAEAASASSLTKRRRRTDDEDDDMSMMNDLFTTSLGDLISSAAKSSTGGKDSIGLVQEVVELVVEDDPSLVKMFGLPLQSTRPVSQAVSTMVINGRASTEVSIQYRLFGPILSATVLTRGTVTDGQPSVENIIIDFPTGVRRDFTAFQIDAVINRASTPSSSSSTSSSSSSNGRSRKDDDVIDTEVIR